MADPHKVPDKLKFWVVWSPQGGPPVVQIDSFEKARIAALKLSSRHPEQDFFVLASCWGKRATLTVDPTGAIPVVDPETPDLASTDPVG